MEIHRVSEEQKRSHMALLLLADPDERMIARYLSASEMYAASEGARTVCVACVLQLDEHTVELKNLATDPACEGKGYASRMIRHLFYVYGGRFSSILVGTSDEMLGFYERFGFVYSHTCRGFFTQYAEPIYENGRLLCDMQYLRAALPAAPEPK